MGTSVNGKATADKPAKGKANGALNGTGAMHRSVRGKTNGIELERVRRTARKR